MLKYAVFKENHISLSLAIEYSKQLNLPGHVGVDGSQLLYYAVDKEFIVSRHRIETSSKVLIGAEN